MEAKSVIAGSLCLVGSIKCRPCTVAYHQNHPTNRASARKDKIPWRLKWDQGICDKETFVDCESLVHTVCREKMGHLAHELLLETKSESFLPNNSTLSAVMLCYAKSGLFPQAQSIWNEILNSSFVPSFQIVSELIDAYGKKGRFDEVTKILDQVSSRGFNFVPQVYSLAISCFGKGGQLELMENTWKKMVSRTLPVDSATCNAIITCYSVLGSLTEMESAYGRLKRSRHLIGTEGIRAMSFAYIKEKKFHRLREFLMDLGLGRKNVGNLVWNLLLLSYAANFKMKCLQREFVRMMDAGFHPDLNTFNIRALAFSRMSLLWDLHLSLEHMKYEKVAPDIVTYGCVVDAYLDRRLGKNLDFALNRMNLDDSPVLLTDPFLFEVLGKGDFHSSSEAFLEFTTQRKWTYRELVAVYLKKQYRSNQIFWNY